MEESSGCVESLLENDPEVMEAAVDLLLKIADNILKEPDNGRFRQVSLKNKAVNRSLVPAVGALEILFLMGFQEGEDHLVLPLEQPLDQLRSYRQQLVRLRGSQRQTAGASQAALPALSHTPQLQTEQEMRERLVSMMEQVAVYESTGLQQKAREVLPIQRLHQLARDKMAFLNKDVKEDETQLDFQDCVLIELLKWFKAEFFRWFDAPTCPQCQKKMTASGSQTPTQEDLLWGASRVEVYSCKACGTSDRFVRYNNPGKLLETREGRCGEWANCFTLLCRTLSMDARYVLDLTDHVWSEVYSQSQQRWLHVDCCEAKMDTPLMYEAGWEKKLSYVLAFSKDEAVDVTWRYTTNQREVLNRRTKCREPWLVTTLMEMNKKHQATFTPEKRNFLEFRMVAEIAEFFTTKKPIKDSEREGRSSGSLAWRLARGETQAAAAATAAAHTSYTFRLTQSEEQKLEFLVKYSTAQDHYVRVSAADEVMEGWQAGVSSSKSIFRKHETDWKIVYLTRTEGSCEGELNWCVDWSHTNLKVKKALVVLQHATFENGCVTWQVCAGDKCAIGPKDGVLELGPSDIGDGVRRLEVSAVLSRGQGDLAWQHAQLCRQPDHKVDQYPLLIHISFQE